MRIRDLYDLLRLCAEVQQFYTTLKLVNVTVRIAFLRLENMYYIHDSILTQLRSAAITTRESTKNHIYDESVNTESTIHELATLVYKHD